MVDTELPRRGWRLRKHVRPIFDRPWNPKGDESTSHQWGRKEYPARYGEPNDFPSLNEARHAFPCAKVLHLKGSSNPRVPLGHEGCDADDLCFESPALPLLLVRWLWHGWWPRASSYGSWRRGSPHCGHPCVPPRDHLEPSAYDVGAVDLERWRTSSSGNEEPTKVRSTWRSLPNRWRLTKGPPQCAQIHLEGSPRCTYSSKHQGWCYPWWHVSGHFPSWACWHHAYLLGFEWTVHTELADEKCLVLPWLGAHHLSLPRRNRRCYWPNPPPLDFGTRAGRRRCLKHPGATSHCVLIAGSVRRRVSTKRTRCVDTETNISMAGQEKKTNTTSNTSNTGGLLQSGLWTS